MSDTYKSIVDQILEEEKSTPQVPETGSATPETPAVEETSTTPVEETTTTENQITEANPSVTKEWYEEETTTVNDKVADPVTQKNDTLEFDDEDIKLIKEYKKQGKTLRDFVNDYKVVDYNSLDDSKVIELALRDLENFSAEDAEQAKDEIDQMPLFQRKKLIQEYRSQFNQINEGKLKELTSSNSKVAEQQDLVMNRFQTELEQTASSITDSEKYGIKITDEMSKEIKRYIAEDMNLQRKDGSFDVDLMVDFALWRKYGKDIVKANVTRAKNEGREEILKATLNPSAGLTSSNQNPGFSSNGVEDAFSQYLKNK